MLHANEAYGSMLARVPAIAPIGSADVRERSTFLDFGAQ
jgi:hypothetical protein